MITITHGVTIARPIDDVFRFVADGYFDHAVRWNPNTVKLKKTVPGPAGEGATGYEEVTAHGKTIQRHFVMRDWKRNAGFRLAPIESSANDQFACAYAFAPAGAGTRVNVTITFEPEGRFAGLMRSMIERNARKDLEHSVGILLKRVVETSVDTATPIRTTY